jgi:hypothetical protein
MLSLVIALGALYVVCDSLCAWHDATHGITGIYGVNAEFDHRCSTAPATRKDTAGAA